MTNIPNDTEIKSKLNGYKSYVKPDIYRWRALLQTLLAEEMESEIRTKERIAFYRNLIIKIDDGVFN